MSEDVINKIKKSIEESLGHSLYGIYIELKGIELTFYDVNTGGYIYSTIHRMGEYTSFPEIARTLTSRFYSKILPIGDEILIPQLTDMVLSNLNISIDFTMVDEGDKIVRVGTSTHSRKFVVGDYAYVARQIAHFLNSMRHAVGFEPLTNPHADVVNRYYEPVPKFDDSYKKSIVKEIKLRCPDAKIDVWFEYDKITIQDLVLDKAGRNLYEYHYTTLADVRKICEMINTRIIPNQRQQIMEDKRIRFDMESYEIRHSAKMAERVDYILSVTKSKNNGNATVALKKPKMVEI